MQLMTIRKFREKTGISRQQIYRYIKRGLLTPRKAGAKLVLLDYDEFNKVFSTNEIAVEGLPDA